MHRAARDCQARRATMEPWAEATIPASCARPLTCRARTRPRSSSTTPTSRSGCCRHAGSPPWPASTSTDRHWCRLGAREPGTTTPGCRGALQAGPDVYQHNDLDRGHLVRRLDPVWGDDSTARTANQDTFTYPNAAPQAAALQPGQGTLGRSGGPRARPMPANTTPGSASSPGPSSTAGDLPYRGIQIPRKFWKIAAWTMEGRLAAAGFLLDQSPLLGPEELARAVRERLLADEPPPLGPFRPSRSPSRRLLP